ncbi:MAG: hypothetical protein V4694_07425 [Pseudomonadota bacterium]
MKKLLTSFAIAALCSISANAQNLQKNAQSTQDVAPVNSPAPVVPTTAGQQQPTTPNAGTNNPRVNQKRDNLNAKWKQQPVNQNDRSADNTKNMSPEERQRMMKAREEKRDDRKEKRAEKKDEKRDERREEAKDKWRSSTPEERKEILQKKEEKLKEHEAKIDARQEKLQNLSPEEKARMEKHQEMMSKLSPQQKESFKKEQERHRQEMKRITGFDI